MFERISELCRKRKISICELEKAVGLGNGTIGKWRTNPNPTCESLYRVAKYFHVRMEWLMGKRKWKRI